MVGFGYDSHRISTSGKLYLGGVLIDKDIGVEAHSDGDVVLHALIDAILGALGKGDIGSFFPDTDPKYKGISSSVLLKEILPLVEQEGKKIVNIDVTIIFELKKLGEFKHIIRKNVAELCGVDIRYVNIKAKTNEKMGFIGKGEGIAAFVVCLLG